MKKILNIAHRGASGYYAENTMLAFEKAIELGADGIELDVQMTKDSYIVVIHDETVDRTTDGHGYVKDFKYEDLRKLNAGDGEKIPTLRQVIETFKDNNLIINIELKNSIIEYEGLEEKVLKLIDEYNIEERIIISSFNHYSIKKVMEINKNIKTGALVEANIYNPSKYISELKTKCYHPQFKSLNQIVMQELKEKNIEVNTYTVNEIEDMIKLITLKVDSIITNYPDKLKALLDR